MTRNAKVISKGLFVGLALLAGVDLAHAAAKKVTICHRSTDEGTTQTISVAEAALPAHLKHGDQVGACASGCESNPSLCDDGNACTSDACLASGQCAHTAVSCDDGNQCTVDSCNSTIGCLNEPAPAGTACDDGKACTSGDACAGTACVGSPVAGCCTANDECDDGDLCTTDSCNGNACTNQPVDCTETNKCLVGFCDPVTGGCGSTPVNCDDSNVCTIDGCDPAIGCLPTPNPNPPEPGREVSCQDGVDNDCDGVTDDSDPDCAAQTICTQARNQAGYLDQFQTEGDGRVSFCHSDDGLIYDFINTSNSACLPHIEHTYDAFPTTLCDN